jgi:SAM-dependent methyltransferase
MASHEADLGGELVRWVSTNGAGPDGPALPMVATAARSRRFRKRWRAAIPAPARRMVRAVRGRWHGHRDTAPVRFGDLHGLRPISTYWGFDRGRPIDRYYVERFLAAHADDIRGRILEIEDDRYTREFGTNVRHVDILHVEPGNPSATIVADLADGDAIPSDAFDCIVLTQTLHLIYDVRAAITTIHRILRPGGVALVTVPGIIQIDRFAMDRWGDYWRFTSRSAHRVFADVFGEDAVSVHTFGNVLTASAFLYGFADHELKPEELDFRDSDFEVSIGLRAVKRAAESSGRNPEIEP